MWTKIRLIALVTAPFCFGFLWGQSHATEAATAEPVVRQEALEAAYAEGWREGSRYVAVHARIDRGD